MDNSENKKSNSIKNEENNITNKNILLKICILTSVILSIVIVFWTFSTEFNVLVIIFTFSLIMEMLFCVWGFYFFITIAKYSYKKKKIVFILLVILLVVLFEFNFNKKETYSLSKVFNHKSYSDENTQPFMYNNKLYYNVNEIFYSDSIVATIIIGPFGIFTQNSINSMNLDGTNNKVLCTNLKNEGDISFKFVRNNELYYTTESERERFYKKINLTNCKKTKIMKGYYELIENKNNIIYMYKDNYNSDDDFTSRTFIKYDIDKNKIVKKIDIHRKIDSFKIDYLNFNIYYVDIEDDDEDISKLYVNDKLLLTENTYHLDLLLLTNNYLFLSDYDSKNDNYNIYQFDLNNNKIVNKIDNKFDDIHTFFNDNNDYYFFADNRVYRYNEEKNEFEDILNQDIKDIRYYDYVYHYGNKLLFKYNYRILIYDTKTKEIKEYNDALYNYDNDTLHIMYEDKKEIKIDNIKVQ